jgi:mono/diheme cytochrome c family protein
MRWLAVITISFCLVLAAWARDKQNTTGVARDNASSAGAAVDGEQVYKSNCTRCHNTPPAMTERQTRVVVRHMRVRANLVADQADAVLQYLTENARGK